MSAPVSERTLNKKTPPYLLENTENLSNIRSAEIYIVVENTEGRRYHTLPEGMRGMPKGVKSFLDTTYIFW